ncbi:MAG: hypothetical protein ACRDTJ_07630 [Pseudonocardiaceae bacterium]
MRSHRSFRLGLALAGVLAVTAPLPAGAEDFSNLRVSAPSPSPSSPSASADAVTQVPSAYVPGKVETYKTKTLPSGWQTYTNSKAKVSFKAPPKWAQDDELASLPDISAPGGGGDDKVAVSAPPWGPEIVQWTGILILESMRPLSFGGGDDGSPPKDPARFGEYLDEGVATHFKQPDRGFRLPNVKAGGKQMYHFVEYDPDGGEVGSRQHSFGTFHNGRHIWISWTFNSHASGAEVQDYLNAIMPTFKFN